LSAFFTFLSCVEGIATISKSVGARRELYGCSSIRGILFIATLMPLCSAGAQTPLAEPPTYVSALASGDDEALREIANKEISPRPDSADLPDVPSEKAAVVDGSTMEARLSLLEMDASEGGYFPVRAEPKPRFQLRSALRQEFEYLMVEHSFRLGQDRALRYQLAHGPFIHNWLVSFKGYDLKRWGDGDDFLVNDIAHPMQGAIASWIFIQNSPVGSTRVIGKDPQYWTSRLKGMAWAAAFEVQWKIGPLSETSIGNAGGWEYVPGCGDKPKCKNNPNFPPPTNNTGLSDWIITPIVGTGWVMVEDIIDKYVAGKVGEHNRLYGNILRSSLEPCRNFAALFSGVVPWNRAYSERRFVPAKLKSPVSLEDEDSWKRNRMSSGFHFVNVNLPGVQSNCIGCRENYPGIGFPYGFHMFEHIYFDSEVNLFPNGSSQGGPSIQGLFGAKVGSRARTWGLYGKIRPGFIYYQKAWSGGQSAHFTDLSRFAVDAGGAFEIYPSSRSTIRFDFGTTLVRYLRDYPSPRKSAIGSLISTDYYVTQGNFQFSTGYRIRF
jgi:hypothetical protein